jgi:hypothetical protein
MTGFSASIQPSAQQAQRFGFLACSSAFAHFACDGDRLGCVSSMLHSEPLLMFSYASRIRSHVTCLACAALVAFSTGCASKRFVPRILSQSVVVGDIPASPHARTPITYEGQVVRPTPPSATVAAGSARRAGRSAIGTTGIGEREWKGSVELTMGLSEFSAAPTEARTTSGEPVQATPRGATLASMGGDSGVLLAIVAIGFALGAIVYRYRAY